MTDLEMDLMLAKAEVAKLKALLGNRCSFGPGVSIKPDGVNDLDPCNYELMETHRNVTVEVLRCKNCGHVEIMWHRQDDTEDGGFDG